MNIFPINLDLSAFSVLLNSFPRAASPVATNSFKSGIVYGDLVFYGTLPYGSPPAGFKMWRVKKSNGDWCSYQSSDASTSVNSGVLGDYCLQTSSTGFSLSQPAGGNGKTYLFTPPNFFTSQANFIVPANPQSIPSPCGLGTLSKIFYCADQDIIAYEFQNTFGGGNADIYAAIYKQNLNGQYLLNGGYICNTLTAGADIFDRQSISYPAGVDTTLDGTTIAKGLNFQRGSFYYIGRTNPGAPNNVSHFGWSKTSCVNNDVLSCALTQKNNTYITGLIENDNLIDMSADNNGYNQNWLSNAFGCGYSEIDDIYLYPCLAYNQNGIAVGMGIIIFNNARVFFIKLTTHAIKNVAAALFKDGTLVFVGDDEIAGLFRVYSVTLNLVDLMLYPLATTSKASVPLINWTRPISLTGAFKA